MIRNSVSAPSRRLSPPRHSVAAVHSFRAFPSFVAFRGTLLLLGLTLAAGLASPQGTYTTNFPATENPLSEGGRWIGGKLTGLDWADARSTPGFAFGTQSGASGFNDSTAVLSGNWGPDQTAQATVHYLNAQPATSSEEVELRLRTSVTAHKITGYEVNFQINPGTGAYIQIVRWNGPLGSFTPLATANGYGLQNGDVVKASIAGSTITVYLNGAQVLQTADSTYATGSPGMGFYLENAPASANSDFGFTSFTATDGTTQAAPGFTLSAVTSGQSIAAGATTSYVLNVAPTNGFSGTVALSAGALPPGASATFAPSSLSAPASSTLTVTTAAATPPATYPLTVTATSGSLTRTVTLTLAITGVPAGPVTCDLNSDGATDVRDVQVAVNRYLGCTATPNISSSAFVSQVINGALGGSCNLATGVHTVAFSWINSQTAGVTYNIYRASASGAYNYTTPLNTAPLTVTSFSDCTVVPGQTYYYVARAIDAGGNASVNSNEAMVPVPTP